MKCSPFFLLLLIAAVGLIAGGCSNDSSSPSTPATLSAGTEPGHLEGQLVAETGTQFSKAFLTAQAITSSSLVYPLGSVTVELLQNGVVVATTMTDEYGRFRFPNLPAGEYDVHAVAPDGAVIHDHVSIAPDQTIAVYGRVISGECLWAEEYGTHWGDMSQGGHWGGGFQGASPGAGCWHDGYGWRNLQTN